MPIFQPHSTSPVKKNMPIQESPPIHVKNCIKKLSPSGGVSYAGKQRCEYRYGEIGYCDGKCVEGAIRNLQAEQFEYIVCCGQKVYGEYSYRYNQGVRGIGPVEKGPGVEYPFVVFWKVRQLVHCPKLMCK
jgi:hypothetical protein